MPNEKEIDLLIHCFVLSKADYAHNDFNMPEKCIEYFTNMDSDLYTFVKWLSIPDASIIMDKLTFEIYIHTFAIILNPKTKKRAYYNSDTDPYFEKRFVSRESLILGTLKGSDEYWIAPKEELLEDPKVIEAPFEIAGLISPSA